MRKNNMINTDSLQKEVRKKFVPYFEKMLDIHGDKIVSAIVYGSAASDGYISGISDINSAFIFDGLSFPVFKNSLKTVSRGISKSVAAPLFLTKDYIFSSLDVFPIEFVDMRDNHVLVYGEDIISGLEIKDEHTRLFCEQQVKGKLVRIQQAYLEVGLSRKGMISLMKQSLNSLVPVFRNLIRLKGEEAPRDKSGVLQKLSESFGLDAEVFLHIYRDSTKDEKITPDEVEDLLGKFMSEIDRLGDMADKLR